MTTNTATSEDEIPLKGDCPMNRTLPAAWTPIKAQLLAVQDERVPDLAAKNLFVLFAGINPGLVYRRHRPPRQPFLACPRKA